MSYILFLEGVLPEDVPDDNDVLNEIAEVEVDVDAVTDCGSDSSFGEMPDLGDAVTDHLDAQYTMPQSGPDSDNDEYDELPEYFTNMADWPTSTNLLCCCCSNRIRDIPWFIPLTFGRIVNRLGREVHAYRVYKVFDSEFCVMRYLNRVVDDNVKDRKWEIIQMFYSVYAIFTGKKVLKIPEAEDPLIQKQYRGPKGITPKEYRERNESKAVILEEAPPEDC
jgi:hypothetical protein